MTLTKPCRKCGKPISFRSRNGLCGNCINPPKAIDCERLKAVWAYILEHQPCTLSEIGQALYGRRSSSRSALTTLESNGFLLWEDDNGKISAFRNVGG